MRIEEFQKGKLYRVHSLDLCVWRPGLDSGSKVVLAGNILLFLDPKYFTNAHGYQVKFYAFLDKDGQELWFEEVECKYLEEANQ